MSIINSQTNTLGALNYVSEIIPGWGTAVNMADKIPAPGSSIYQAKEFGL